MKQIVERKLNEVRAQLRAMPKAFTPPKCTADRQKLLVAIMQQYLRYLSDCIRGEYWDRVLVRHPELRMYNTVVKKFEIFQAQVREWLLVLCWSDCATGHNYVYQCYGVNISSGTLFVTAVRLFPLTDRKLGASVQGQGIHRKPHHAD
jgi:hypothetical protein